MTLKIARFLRENNRVPGASVASWGHAIQNELNRPGDRQQTAMNTLAAIALVLLTFAPAPLQTTTDVTGKWTGTLTRSAPDGRTQSIDFMFDLVQKGKDLSGTAGPNAERQWKFEKGVVEGTKVKFQVQQPDGPLRTFTLAVVEGRLTGEMLAELNGQSFTTTVDLGRAKAK